MGFWVYGRWVFGPLAFETGDLKFQREVRSSPKPNNAMPPFISSAVHRKPKAFGLWALAVGVLCLAACSYNFFDLYSRGSALIEQQRCGFRFLALGLWAVGFGVWVWGLWLTADLLLVHPAPLGLWGWVAATTELRFCLVMSDVFIGHATPRGARAVVASLRAC